MKRPATFATLRSIARRASRAPSSTSKIFCRKGAEKDERHKAIEASQVFRLERNLADEIRILTDERLKRLSNLLDEQKLVADLHDEKTNKRLLTKGTVLTRDIIEKISTRNLKRLQPGRQGSSAHREDRRDRGDDLAADRRTAQDHRRAQGQAQEGRRTAARRHQAGQGLHRHEAQAVGRRQDGRPPRQQGRHRAHRARRRHALLAGRHSGGNRAQSARRALAHERRADSRDPPRLGVEGTRPQSRAAVQHRHQSRSGSPVVPRSLRRHRHLALAVLARRRTNCSN